MSGLTLYRGGVERCRVARHLIEVSKEVDGGRHCWLRFGLTDGQPRTLEEIGHVYGGHPGTYMSGCGPHRGVSHRSTACLNCWLMGFG